MVCCIGVCVRNRGNGERATIICGTDRGAVRNCLNEDVFVVGGGVTGRGRG